MRLNLDNFQQPKSQQIQKQFSTVENFLTHSKLKSQQSRCPKVSIFDKVLIVSLNLKKFKTQILAVEKLLTVAKPSLDSQEILDSFKTRVSTVLITLSLKS